MAANDYIPGQRRVNNPRSLLFIVKENSVYIGAAAIPAKKGSW